MENLANTDEYINRGLGGVGQIYTRLGEYILYVVRCTQLIIQFKWLDCIVAEDNLI